MALKKKGGIYKKLHRWPGLIIAFVLLFYAVTGIIMNHRELLSGIDVDRDLLPSNYAYTNWNNAAVKGNLILSGDSILVYGNIGIWLTDSTFTRYESFNAGFPKGSDNRKISDLHLTARGSIFATSLFGLYGWDPRLKEWKKLMPEKGTERFVAMESRGDTLFALSRSHLYTGADKGVSSRMVRNTLPPPEGYKNKVTLFETIWQFHSGEIFGLPGKLFVDLLGVVTLLLSATGIIYFFFPSAIHWFRRKGKSTTQVVRVNKWSLKWHNKLGAWLFILLALLYFTGMFLRPPLLIAIAAAKVTPLKYSHLDQPNPWNDKLRDIVWEQERSNFLLSTSDGMYRMNPGDLKSLLMPYQPPVSVMGINTFESAGGGAFLIGSFSGLFLWHPSSPTVYNYLTGEIYQGDPSGRPVGELKVTGHVTGTAGQLYIFDYGAGAIPAGHPGHFPEMPENIRKEAGMSLWNFALEIHTGRIFEFLTGGLYILIVPLAGVTAVMVVISGYLLWRKKHRKHPRQKKTSKFIRS